MVEKDNHSFKKVRSKYNTQEIFDMMQSERILNIIRYNKNLQSILEKNINDYIKEYLKIKMEIFPIENKYGKFINISNMKYYHIYFNDNFKETKRDYIIEEDNASKIKIVIDNDVKNLFGLFYNIKFIKKINFIKFNRNDIKNMLYIFKDCSSLEELNLSKFNTDNLKNMEKMFYGCSLLKELNLSNFTTINVSNMNHIFNGCNSLKRLNISNFNTYKVEDMSHMFSGCSSLIELNLTNFNTSKVVDMSNMFSGCSSLI